MASLTQVALVLLLCLVIMQQHSDFVSGYGYGHAKAAVHSEVRNRKVLNEKDMEGWELRSVPSGPDPLHHNANPKKPRTP